MTDLWTYLKCTEKPIVLYGTGNGADKIIKRLREDNIKFSGIFSSDGFKKNKVFAGHTVCDYASLKEKLGDMIILLCFGSDRPEVIENIRRLANENELYVPDVPVYGEEIFDIPFARKNADRLREVYEMLSDDASKKVFENTVYFKITGKPEYLYACESSRAENYRLLALGDSESFLDLGAFNGDTAAEFIENVKNYANITVVEPDSRNFKRLCENTADFKSISRINAAIGEKNGTVMMSKQHGRGLGHTAKTVAVPCTTIDTLAAAKAPTFIKMDVEGAELSAIKGGEATIKNHTPKLKIACYHNSSDLFEIPLKIKELVPQYKIYLRHNPCLPAWDLDYVFIL